MPVVLGYVIFFYIFHFEQPSLSASFLTVSQSYPADFLMLSSKLYTFFPGFFMASFTESSMGRKRSPLLHQ